MNNKRDIIINFIVQISIIILLALHAVKYANGPWIFVHVFFGICLFIINVFFLVKNINN